MALAKLFNFLFGPGITNNTPTDDNMPVVLHWKVDGFSSLLDPGASWCSSNLFTAGGRTWRFHLLPPQNKTDEQKDYVTMSLNLNKVSYPPSYLEVKAVIELCIHNQLSGEHIKEKGEFCFNANKNVWGLYKIYGETFNTLGLLVDDCCILSIEISNVRVRRQIVEDWSLLKEPKMEKHTCTIKNFSNLCYRNDLNPFVAAGHIWHLIVFPGMYWCGDSDSRFLAVFLEMDSYKTLSNNGALIVQFGLHVIDQINGNNHEWKGYKNYSSKETNMGFPKVMPVGVLRDPSKGFLLHNTCVMEVSIRLMGTVSRD